MKKFILAEDGLALSEAAMDYAAFFSKEFDAHIVAAFLEDFSYKSKPVGQEIWWPYFSEKDLKRIEAIDKKDAKSRESSIRTLEKKFQNAGIPFNIHKDRPLALESLIMESHFADAIIISAEASFSNYDKTKPSHFLRNILNDAGCPVILTPDKFSNIEKFVFAYDGNPASAFAMRQFTYLFPDIKGRELEIVYATSNKNSSHLPHQQLLKELLKRKYSSIQQSVLRATAIKEHLLTHLLTENKNCMIVMGAYDRSAFSMWLQQSTANRLIQDLKAPLFIAHH